MPGYWAPNSKKVREILGRDKPETQTTLDTYIQLAACMYQAAGVHNFPSRWMDCLSAAQNGEPFKHMLDGLLPISEDEEGWIDGT